MTLASAVVGVAFVAFIVEAIVEIVLEIFGQLIFELVVEGGRKLFGLGRRATASATIPPAGHTTRISGPMWVAAIVIGAAFGFWRGSRADTVTWGFGLAVVVVVVALVAAQREPRGVQPEGRWKRLLFWWPSDRLYWFAAANASFVVAYLAALTTGS